MTKLIVAKNPSILILTNAPYLDGKKLFSETMLCYSYRVSTLIRYGGSLPVIILVLVGIELGFQFHPAYWAIGAIALFIVHPLLDTIVGQNKKNNKADPRLAKAILYLYAIFQTVLLYRSLAASQELFLAGISTAWYMILAVSIGVLTGSFGITFAHELFHAPDKLSRGLGVWLLLCVSYSHFRIEHVFGHHKDAATPLDTDTALRGESFYRFLVRSFLSGYTNAWRIEAKRLTNKSSLAFIFANRFIKYSLMQAMIYALIYYFFGVVGLLFFAAQSLVAIVLLEVVNYIEHYGLQRKKLDSGRYESYGPQHTWDNAHVMTNALLINLGKHSHHHISPSKHYQELELLGGAFIHPYGYAVMVWFALIPPLWFSVMDWRIDARVQAGGIQV